MWELLGGNDANRKTCGPCNDVKVNLIKMPKAFVVLVVVVFLMNGIN